MKPRLDLDTVMKGYFTCYGETPFYQRTPSSRSFVDLLKRWGVGSLHSSQRVPPRISLGLPNLDRPLWSRIISRGSRPVAVCVLTASSTREKTRGFWRWEDVDRSWFDKRKTIHVKGENLSFYPLTGVPPHTNPSTSTVEHRSRTLAQPESGFHFSGPPP